ncbi:hypothetical protein L1987_19797 [Smallanthus sonchifolius]|uniref:Uncharacterized protein n=1 Tax=Smallanthus sonchifolius TaxID=185202 RepID=A0ACB9IQ16_9ASTR|nr:hypothetical protein L1987_19797 [Smallanthus sonchifolius]
MIDVTAMMEEVNWYHDLWMGFNRSIYRSRNWKLCLGFLPIACQKRREKEKEQQACQKKDPQPGNAESLTDDDTRSLWHIAKAIHKLEGNYQAAKWNGTKVSMNILNKDSYSDPETILTLEKNSRLDQCKYVTLDYRHARLFVCIF